MSAVSGRETSDRCTRNPDAPSDSSATAHANPPSSVPRMTPWVSRVAAFATDPPRQSLTGRPTRFTMPTRCGRGNGVWSFTMACRSCSVNGIRIGSSSVPSGSSDISHSCSCCCWSQYSSGVNPLIDGSLDARVAGSAAYALVTKHTEANATKVILTTILALRTRFMGISTGIRQVAS
jgi:hypothetical protein